MKKIDYCVCCESKNIETFPGHIAGFVIDRMTGNNKSKGNIDCKYIHCIDCDYIGCDVRFELEEEKLYYKNYMKEEYINHRCQYEGEGMRSILNYHSEDEYRKIRRRGASVAMDGVIDFSKIASVLDFGGDTGDMIPIELSHCKKYVTDVEVRKLNIEVISIQSPEDCGPVDLVICGHVIEHVSDPNNLINEIKKYLRSGGWIYLEAPLDYTPHGPGHGFHEHLNRFNLTSAENILLRHGFVNLTGAEINYQSAVDTAWVVMGQLK
jgi:SAM-dependent methyltransferase